MEIVNEPETPEPENEKRKVKDENWEGWGLVHSEKDWWFGRIENITHGANVHRALRVCVFDMPVDNGNGNLGKITHIQFDSAPALTGPTTVRIRGSYTMILLEDISKEDKERMTKIAKHVYQSLEKKAHQLRLQQSDLVQVIKLPPGMPPPPGERN